MQIGGRTECHTLNGDLTNYTTYLNCTTVVTNKEKREISYNLKPPVTSFTGRDIELNELQNIFRSEDEHKSESTLIAVVGLAGTGKTELARKYAYESFKYYKSIVWVDSETSESIKSTFETLAKDELGIIENPKNCSIQVTMRKVYEYLSESKTLIIFDNAEGYAIIKECLPPLFKGNIKNIHVLFTSQTRDWEVMDEGNIQEIFLNELLPEDAKKFVKKSLDQQNVHDDDIRNLIEELAFFPLALTQSVAYINQQFRTTQKMHVSKRYGIIDFLNEYNHHTKKFLDYANTIHHRYANTVYKTLELTFKKISKEKDGKFALDVITTIAYLAPDKIPITQMFGDVGDAVHLLHKYSVITISNGEASVHRLLQQVTRVRNRDNEVESLRKALTVVNKTRFIEDSEGNNAMHAMFVWSYASKHSAFIRDVYSAFYTAFTYGDRKSTPLQLFVWYGKNEAAKDLLSNVRSNQLNSLCEYKDFHGVTPLISAIYHKNVEIVKLLVDSGCDCNALDDSGHLPLIDAIFYDNVEIVKLLVSNGCDCNMSDGYGHLPLLEAVYYGNVEIVRMLLENGANRNVFDRFGDTPLSLAVSRRNEEIVRLLL